MSKCSMSWIFIEFIHSRAIINRNDYLGKSFFHTFGVKNWPNGSPQSIFQGTAVRAQEPRILNLDAAPHLKGTLQQRNLALLQELNRDHLGRHEHAAYGFLATTSSELPTGGEQQQLHIRCSKRQMFSSRRFTNLAGTRGASGMVDTSRSLSRTTSFRAASQ